MGSILIGPGIECFQFSMHAHNLIGKTGMKKREREKQREKEREKERETCVLRLTLRSAKVAHTHTPL